MKHRFWKKLLAVVIGTLSIGTFTACNSGPANGTKFTVHFVSNCEEEVKDKIYTVGEKFTFPTPSKFGSKFDGWCYDQDLTKLVDEKKFSIASDTTLYGKWHAVDYHIVFDTDTDEFIDDIVLKFGETVTLPTPQPKLIAGKLYDFDYWFYTAEGTKLRGEYTLTYPEDVYLTAVYDIGVEGGFKLNEKGMYYLGGSTKSCATFKGKEFVYGTLEGDITFSSFTSKGGFIWNAILNNSSNPWQTECQYNYFHMNSSNGAMQLATVNSDEYAVHKTIQLGSAPASFRNGYAKAKEEGNDFTFHFRVENMPDKTEVYLNEELTASYTWISSDTRVRGVGFGLRADSSGISFSELKVTPTHYQINFDTGAGHPIAPIQVEANAIVPESSLPIPNNPSYRFEGWKNQDGTNYDDSKPITSCLTLVASYSKIDGGALVYFDANNETSIDYIFVGSGAPIRFLPIVAKLGFDFKYWYYLNNEQEVKVTEDTILVEASYQGATKEIILYAKWQKSTSVIVSDFTLTTVKGNYVTNNNYDGYVAYDAKVNSFATLGQMADGVFSAYVRFATFGANGFVFGALLQDDFGTECNADFMQIGSSYYYLHFNNSSGLWQFAKVTDATNDQSLNEENPGYDLLANGKLDGFKAGSRHFVSVESFTGPDARYFKVFVDSEEICSVKDDGSIAGPCLPGNLIGFRNAGGGCTYYGLRYQSESELDHGTINLNIDGQVTPYIRAYGHPLNIPSPSKEGYSFAGWTTVKDDVSTFFNTNQNMTETLNGLTLYPYFASSTQTVILWNANGGDCDISASVFDKGYTLKASDIPSISRYAYNFVGWYDEETAITEGTKLENNLYLAKAKWGSVVSNLIVITPDSLNKHVPTGMAIENDGVYDYYAFTSGAGIAKFDGELLNGSIGGFIKTYTGDVSKVPVADLGIVIRGTSLLDAPGTASYDKYSCYFLRFAQTSGNMILYDMGKSSGVGAAITLKASNWDATKFGKTWLNNIQEFEINFVEVENVLTITVSINQVEAFSVNINNPYQGTQLGLRIAGNKTAEKTMQFFGMHTN